MNKVHDKRVALVTGATGFVGSNLAKALHALGWEVHAVVRKQESIGLLQNSMPYIFSHLHDGSMASMQSLMEKSKPDCVFHLASLFISEHKQADVENLVESNILFSLQLVEAMSASDVKYLVNTGTSWQYYNSESYNPVNLYAATKQAFESLISYYVDAFGLKVANLVLSDTYGPRDSRQKLMNLLLRAAKSNDVLNMSPGEQEIDLVHIDDVVNAFVLAAEQLPSQSLPQEHYSVFSGVPLSLKNLVAMMQQELNITIPVVFGSRPYRKREVMRVTKVHQSVPGWLPRITLSAGIKSIFEQCK